MSISKFKNFLSLDIRWKIKFIGRFLKLKLYPERFYLTGWKSIYSKIIFYLIFKEKSNSLYKKNYNLLFKKTYKKTEVNSLVALPRSGSNFLRNLITTYISLEKKISNGVPKYDGITDTWKMLPSTIFPADMYNAVSLDEENFKIQAILEQNEIDRKKIFFSRHPINKADLTNIMNSKIILLLRTPKDQVKSWILTKAFNYNYSDKEFENELIIQIKKKILFLKFWNDHFFNLKIPGLIIDFNKLSENTGILFREILKFYNYEFDEKNFLKAIEINKKENYRIYMGEGTKSIRFMNSKIKNKYLDKYEKFIFINQSIKEAEKLYIKLISAI